MAATGMEISPQTAETLAKATHGYPFLIQLVGYHAWENAKRAGSMKIDDEVARMGITVALSRFNSSVIEPALQRTSPAQISSLLAMAVDGEGPSEVGVVASRLGETLQQVSSCRARLLRDSIIESPSRGFVRYCIPYMGKYLNEHRDELRRPWSFKGARRARGSLAGYASRTNS